MCRSLVRVGRPYAEEIRQDFSEFVPPRGAVISLWQPQRAVSSGFPPDGSSRSRIPLKKPKAVPLPVQARMLNVHAAASYLGATVWFVRTAVWEDKLKAVKFGSRLLFPREELDAFIDRAKAGVA
jgi:excisionase family DNA binding protein